MPVATQVRFTAVSGLLVLALSGGLHAQPDPRPVRGPVMGFVHDKAAGIRPILGLPGAATLGPPVLGRAAFESVALASARDYALVTVGRGREVAIVSRLSSAPAATMLDVPAGPSRIALSPSGDTAALYFSDGARLEVFSGLPDLPARAWGIDLAGVESGLAALVVSDGGGTVLIAAAGQPASIWTVSSGEGQRFLYAATASPLLTFFSQSQDAAIADPATGEVMLVREQRLTRIGGPSEGIRRPTAVAPARDNTTLFVAVGEPAGVVVLNLSGGEPVQIGCACTPTTLEPLADGSGFRLSELGDGPVWLLDTAGPAPRTLLVPDQTGPRRDAVPVRRPLSALARAPQAALEISTGSVLPWATLAVAYSQALTAAGGAPPYTWSVASGALPPGLSLDTSGMLNGTPTEPGPFYFTVTVTDTSGASASKAFSLLVILPATPAVSITGLQDTVNPADQPEFNVELSSAYPQEVTGSITLTFEPDAVNPSDDPAVQFSTGGRTLSFTLPAGQTSAAWPSTHAVQTGSVAGRIKLRLQFSAGGRDLTPTFPPVRSVSVARAAPKIESVQVAKTAGGFNLLIKGYATPREVTSASFDFTAAPGGASQTVSVTVDVKSVFTTWYTGASATQYGSAFLYTQPFTVQGNLSDISSVSVMLSNSMGASEAATASF